jgi:phenylpropionate dioxygenase-like ring-hydroxylating dioxygenase large terminal subunit
MKTTLSETRHTNALPLPGHRYTSAAFFAEEWERMWTKVWLLLGREDEMPEPGDYQVEEVGPESILMVRQRDGSVKAFYNVCQHRGNRLKYDSFGSTDRLTCVYHGWQYDLDGRLLYAQDPEDFPQGDPCRFIRLVDIPCESFAGFIWVNMDPDCVPLKQYLGPIHALWQSYPVAEMKRLGAKSARMPCNWKVIQDNFAESYHLPATHPSTNAILEDHYADTDFYTFDGGHGLMKMKALMPGVRALESGAPLMNDFLRERLREWDLDPVSFVGREREIRVALQQQKRKVGPSRGYHHYAAMEDSQLTDYWHFMVFPNVAVSATSDGFHLMRQRPLGADPARCRFDNWFYATMPEGEARPVQTPVGVVARDAEVEHELFDYGEKSLGRGAEEDMGNMLGQQQGFMSRGYRGALLAGQEGRIKHYHDTIDRYLAGELPARGA